MGVKYNLPHALQKVIKVKMAANFHNSIKKNIILLKEKVDKEINSLKR